MAYRLEKTKDSESIVIDGWENGIASSPYLGVGNIRNLSAAYYPGVAYANYKRLAATIVHTITLTGSLSTNAVSATLSTNWLYATGAYTVLFSNGDSRSATLTKGATTMTWSGGLTGSATSSVGVSMSNPVQKAVSPAGLIYVQDESGRIWKQSAVHSSTFNILEGSGRVTNGAGGIAYWNNYLWVFGNEMIEVCGDGSGDVGITSSYWNYNGGSGFAQNPIAVQVASAPTEYLSIPTVYSTPKIYWGAPVTFTSTGTLPAPLVAGQTYYLAYNYGLKTSPSSGWAISDTVEGLYTRTNGTSIASAATSATLNVAWPGTNGVRKVYFNPLGATRWTGGFYQKDVTFTNGSTNITWTGGIGADVDPDFITVVTFTTTGTGTHSMSINNSGLPLGNYTNVNFGTFTGSAPNLVGEWTNASQYYLSLGSSVDPKGVTTKGLWQGATGIYNMVMANGQKIPMSIVSGSNNFSFLSGFTYRGFGPNWKLQLLSPTVTNYKPYVSKVDGSLMFCNGQFIGRISLNSDPNVAFNPSLPSTYYVNFGVASIPEQFTDTVQDMTDLRANLVVAGKSDTYTWDYVSASCSSPAPVGEEIKGLVNILSNVYVLAGEKGNIYGSNGYSNQLLYKLPDFIAGIIDPVWKWGDVMLHRSKFFFQVLAKKTDGTNLLAGIFSLNVSPTAMGDSAKGLVMEAQNSYGLTPASGATEKGLLISDNPSANGNDSYYSVWSNGANLGGIDYNDTTLWQNFEPVIETDLIPLASVLEKKSLGNLEFKLDRPMVSGDQIRLSWRSSATGAYTTVGTFTDAVISDYKQSDIAQAQWVQFKAEFKCASSGSSFIPLREIRVHLV